MKFEANCLKTDKRRFEHECWQAWMDSAAQLAATFYNDVYEDDPFSYNETASVGFLATAASRVGILALPEFRIDKVDAVDRRRRSMGRADLWLRHPEGRDRWFEFKQHFIFRGSVRDLERKWSSAEQCANQVKNNGVAVAGLIVSFSLIDREDSKLWEGAQAAVREIADRCRFAWRILGGANGPETYVLLDIAKAGQ